MNIMRQQIEAAALGAAEIADGTGRQSFCFSEDFIGFAGHFPGYPILPAVLQALLAQRVAEQLCGKPLQFLALERAKFTRQLRPGEPIAVTVKAQKEQGQLHCHCELRVEENRAASFSLLLTEGETS